MIFAKSVRAGPPYRALYTGDCESLVKALLADKLFEVMEGDYGPDADADGLYSEKMNCTVLLSRSGELWVTAQKGQPSSDLHYQAVLADSR